MVWANEGSCAPPTGFQILGRYVKTLALHHGLPLAQLDFCLSSGSSLDSNSDAEVIAHGHHSVVVTLGKDADCVIKVSNQRSLDTEMRVHAAIDPYRCFNLRAALPGMVGTVKGAGNGLTFIGLEGLLTPLPSFPISHESLTQFFDQVQFHSQVTLFALGTLCDH